jgi:DNA helicase-2/ATP-dependent DNA helicase PcrA
MKDEITKSQKKAVEHFNGPALVIAGPGAGKTFVITERVKHLITNKKIKPENILVTTFTEKAAGELKVRLAREVGASAELAHISTIHSFCKSMLERYFPYHDYGAAIDVLDDESQYLLLDQHKTELGFACWDRNKINYVKNGIGRGTDVIKSVAAFYDTMTQNEIDPDELLENMKSTGLLEQGDVELVGSFRKYRTMLAQERLVDFASLQTDFLRLIREKPEILSDIQSTFLYMLVDEYQDTSPVQDRIFRVMAGARQNIFVVGDENQSIYGFRGASIRNFRQFLKRYPKAVSYFLNVNFRSTGKIVDFSNRVFEKEMRKILEARRRAGEKIRIIDGADVDDAARLTVDFIKRMKKVGIIKSYGDVALLFRSLKHHAKEYIKHLEREGVPFVSFGDGGFFERKEIQVMIYLLSYIDRDEADSCDTCCWQDWKEWWRRDLFLTDFLDFSPETRKVIQEGEFNLRALYTDRDFSKAGFRNTHDIEKMKKINLLKNTVAEERENRDDFGRRKHSLLTVFYNLLDYTGYFRRLMKEGSRESEEKLANLAKLSSIIARYQEMTKKERTIDFLWYCHNREYDMDQEKIEGADTVKLMTVHRAKGMEFPVVFVCCLVEGRFPVRYRDSRIVRIPEHFLQEEGVDREEEHYQEERRLFYVAATRAQDNLIFTTADKITCRKAARSRFLDAVKEEHLDTGDFSMCAEKEYHVSSPVPNLNYSAINAFVDCPLRYLLLYHYGFQTPEVFMQHIGLFVHAVLQKIHERMRNGEEAIASMIGDTVGRYWKDLPVKKDRNERIRESYVKKFLAYYEKARELFTGILAVEESFSHIDDNMILNGKVDLIARDRNNEVCLVDFKARTSKGIELTNVATQLRIYDYCMDRQYNIGRLIAFTFEDNTPNEFEKKQREKTREFLTGISEKIASNRFDPQENSFCPQCHFNFYCKSEL